MALADSRGREGKNNECMHVFEVIGPFNNSQRYMEEQGLLHVAFEVKFRFVFGD